MQQLNGPGDYIEYAVGSTTIRLQMTVDGAFSRIVFHSTYRVDELSAIHTDETIARSQARYIAVCLKGGISIHQLATDAANRAADVLAATAGIVNAAPTLPDTVPAGVHRQVRATVAGAHLTPIADAQDRAIRTAAERTNRTVYAGEETRPTLKALARKGYGVLNYQPGLGRRKVVESLTLNSRGLAHASTVAA